MLKSFFHLTRSNEVVGAGLGTLPAERASTKSSWILAGECFPVSADAAAAGAAKFSNPTLF
jgi:hypothetical protein